MNDDNKQMMEGAKCQLSAAQLKEQALRARMIDDAPTPYEKERLRAEFAEWNKQGKPITEGIAERDRKMREAWQSELWSRIVSLLEKGAALDPAAIPESRRNQTLDVLDVAVRVQNVLQRGVNVETIWDLVHIPSQEFMKRRVMTSRRWWLLIIDAIEQALKTLTCEQGD
jgi:hypothetical protein